MKKKLYQKPNIKVHELPMDALLAASLESVTTTQDLNSAIVGNPTSSGPSSMLTINSKRGNLWGDDEE